jgi:Malic enzyme, NAD binding domain
MQKHGLSEKDANANFWVLDKDGLVTHQRSELFGPVVPFARAAGGDDVDGEKLVDVVTRVRPDRVGGADGRSAMGRHEVVR